MTHTTPSLESGFSQIPLDESISPIPADMSIEDFYAMPVDEQLDLGRQICGAYQDVINDHLRDSVDPAYVHITIGIPTGEVLAFHTPDDEPLSQTRVKTMAREAVTRCLPFTFARPIFANN